jgi:hypothetical protein
MNDAGLGVTSAGPAVLWLKGMKAALEYSEQRRTPVKKLGFHGDSQVRKAQGGAKYAKASNT